MNKSIAVIVALVGVLAVAPWGVGKVVEKRLDQGVDTLVEKAMGRVFAATSTMATSSSRSASSSSSARTSRNSQSATCTTWSTANRRAGSRA